jgi:hypothetical protein
MSRELPAHQPTACQVWTLSPESSSFSRPTAIVDDAYEHPMVREQDIKQLEGHGWCFLPVRPEDLTLEGSHRSTGRVLEVIFSGGRRVIVEVYHQPADLSDPHFFNAFGHYT